MSRRRGELLLAIAAIALALAPSRASRAAAAEYGRSVLRGSSAFAAGRRPSRRPSSSVASTPHDTSTLECEKPLDIVLCLDTSGSIGPDNWKRVLAFVVDLASFFDFAAGERARVGIVHFSNYAYSVVGLRDFDDYAEWAANVNASGPAWYDGGYTYTNLGILQSEAMLAQSGRPVNEGFGHLLILITDGQSTDPAATQEAAASARNEGMTISVVTIGPPEDFNEGEIEGIVNFDATLIFPIESWLNVATGAGIVANITGRACGGPVVLPDTLPNITSDLGCNASASLAYPANNTRPLTLRATITAGSILLCHSYVTVLPSAHDPTGASVCSAIGLGTTHVSTATAYPVVNSSDPSQAHGTRFLYVTVEAVAAVTPGVDINASGCGGNYTIDVFYCSTRVAVNVTGAVNGSLANASIIVLGDPTQPACAECPGGTAFLSLDADSPFYRVCAASCASAAQFAAIDLQTGLETCQPCDASCGACAAYGGPRACTACAPGQALLPNLVDPALQSPFWLAFPGGVTGASGGAASLAALQQALPDPLTLDGRVAGRCIVQCPAGYALGSSGACAGAPADFARAQAPTALLVTLGLPLAPSVPQPLPAPDCRSLLSPSSGAQTGVLAGAIAVALGVPPSAVFLRACVDFGAAADPNIRWMWTYASSGGGANAAVSTSAPGAVAAVAMAAATCNISAVATFAVVLGLEAPGAEASAAARGVALSALAANAATLLARSLAAMPALAAAVQAAMPAPPPLPLVQSCNVSGARFSFTAAVVLASCVQLNESLDAIPSATELALRNSATLCDAAPAPPPQPSPGPVPPSNGAATGGAESAVGLVAVAVPVALLLLICVTGSLFYSSWRRRRLATVEEQRRRLELASKSVGPISPIPAVDNPMAAEAAVARNRTRARFAPMVAGPAAAPLDQGDAVHVALPAAPAPLTVEAVASAQTVVSANPLAQLDAAQAPTPEWHAGSPPKKAAPALMSMSQSIQELLAPGSVSLGLGLFGGGPMLGSVAPPPTEASQARRREVVAQQQVLAGTLRAGIIQ